ncbi:MAG: hypothetical protein ACI9CQ_003425 [Saprospiraceae bacterium]|jgi:hypothetical protein
MCLRVAATFLAACLASQIELGGSAGKKNIVTYNQKLLNFSFDGFKEWIEIIGDEK